MNVFAIDLSMKPGWAYFKDGKLITFGTIFSDARLADYEGSYPFNFTNASAKIASSVIDLLCERFPDVKNRKEVKIVIEETTGSSNNYSQKILEFLHCNLIGFLESECFTDISYIRTGVWRKIVGATQTKEERNYNSKVARTKKKTGKKIAMIDGKRTRPFNRKDYALRVFKEEFGIELDMKMNDACDAALVGLAYLRGGPICDGTTTGGTLSGAK